jgi:hypothetical protein
MSLRLLRAEVWARDDVKKLHRVSMRILPDERLEAPAVVVISRLVVTGGNHHRLHEELTEAGGYLRDTTFRREERVTELRRWLDEAMPVTIPDHLFDALRTRFEKHREAILTAIEARAKDRLRHLSNTLDTRRQKEGADIHEVLDELERGLKAELAQDDEPKQFELFSEDERTQLKRDRATLEVRLARIPIERENELAAIDARYTGLDDRTFPVAVIFLVPSSMVGGYRV